MFSRQGLGALIGKLFGRRAGSTPADIWLSRRGEATPEAVVQEYFAAIAAHDLDWMLATMTPERARLYSDPRTLDKRRNSIERAQLLRLSPADGAIVLPDLPVRYRDRVVLQATFSLDLVEPDRRRDPSLFEGEQTAYFVLVRERTGRPWMIADWGT